MSFGTLCVLILIPFALCFAHVRRTWRHYSNDRIIFAEIEQLRSYNILSRVWPCDDGFASLTWSALRHTVVSLVLSALIWFVNAGLLNGIATFLGLLYVWPAVARYRVRRADYVTAGPASQEMLRPIKSACFSVVLLAGIDYLLLMICYGFRP